MTQTILISKLTHFNRDQLEAIDQILQLLDTEEFRDYHDQFGVCNAPENIEKLRTEVRRALSE
jgi:hypothetical protein